MEIEAYKKNRLCLKKALVLKVKTYENISNHDNDVCSICISEINHRDRIGVISCEHMFHVDCLKVWLKRKNVCPLCMCQVVTETRIMNVEHRNDNVVANV